MTEYSKYNIVYRLQKWMDSVPGQTFLNYAYSWGASIVVLGALFKLTHLPYANFMLFLGMGTEVFVFFISAFDRPFDKTTDGMDLPTHVTEEYLEGKGGQSETLKSVQNKVTFTAEAPKMSENSTIVMPSVNPEMAEAQTNYIAELNKLTEVLEKVGDQSSRLARDSEEMENLNRTLTGISRVYEMQLKSASQQIGTIDQINEQSKLLAKHIEQLNGIYTRMIEAMTINMRAAAPTQNTQL